MGTLFQKALACIRRLKQERVLAGLGAVAAFGTVLVGVIGILQNNDLQAENNRLQRAALDSHLEEVMMGLDRHFVAYPELRRFFYSRRARSLPPPGRLRDKAMGTAELIIDFADDVGAYTRTHKMEPEDGARWASLVRGYFEESPVTRFAWKEFSDSYDEATACILGAPFGQKLRGWSWRSNTPRESASETCADAV